MGVALDCIEKRERKRPERRIGHVASGACRRKNGAETSIYLASAAAAGQHRGDYLIKCRTAGPKPWAEDDSAAERLWGPSATLLAERQLSV